LCKKRDFRCLDQTFLMCVIDDYITFLKKLKRMLFRESFFI